jgi:hypothetical protein
MAGGMDQMIMCLPSKPKTLYSNSKNNKKSPVDVGQDSSVLLLVFLL